MSYKVFFVEDEIITREGIRDNVDWQASGFEFCGEAADGEMALPLLRTAQPDVLITDIKMPFMDGLQLIVRATSLGDVHSMMLYPVMSSHREVSPKHRERMGIRDNLVRLSVGIEAVEDIIEDLEKALAL
jgi:DNA-binding NarL/FixJ family response regulator